MSRSDALEQAVLLMERVQIPGARQRVRAFPHQFSGGMRQRIMIAMAIALDPAVLIADEPTTALDVTVQAQIMQLLQELQAERKMGLILITHDLGVVADVADRIAVMYAGRIVEQADVYDLYARPAHPYTQGLLESIPRLDQKGEVLAAIGGLPPNLTRIPPGCPFNPRCRYAQDVCRHDPRPALREVEPRRLAACHFSELLLLESPELEVTQTPDQVEHAAEFDEDGAAADTCRGGDDVRRTGAPRPRWRRRIMSSGVDERGYQPAPTAGNDGDVILRAENLMKHYPIRAGVLRRTVGHVKAVDGVSFDLHRGETLGVVGESGCGKSTLGRLLMRLEEPTGGKLSSTASTSTPSRARDAPAAPRHPDRLPGPVHLAQPPQDGRRHRGGALRDPPRRRAARRAPAAGRRSCSSSSGSTPSTSTATRTSSPAGSGSASASPAGVALNPKVIICDEPVSALDVSVQAQVVNLLEKLQAELGLAYIFIAHDLSVVRHISDRVAVMYLGSIVEIGDEDQIYSRPTHPYTQALLSAVPVPDPTLRGSENQISADRRRAQPGEPAVRLPVPHALLEGAGHLLGEDPDLDGPARRLSAHASACHFAEPRAVV